MSQYCIECGTSLPEGAKFCLECGTPVTVPNSGVSLDVEGAVGRDALVAGHDIHIRHGGKQVREEHYRIALAWDGKQSLREFDLAERDLSEIQLPGADLRRANLEKTTLYDANLQAAKLQEANLKEADLSGANLERASLWRANLHEADLTAINLKGAYLDNAILTSVSTIGADMSRAKLSGAILKDNLFTAKAKEAWLIGTNLENVHFVLEPEDLEEAAMMNAKLKGSRGLTDEILERIDSLRGATMPDGSRYDGRFSLLGDLINAQGDIFKVDINDPPAMADHYGVSLETYLAGQQAK